MATGGVDTGGVDNRTLRARADELMGELERLRAGMGDLQKKLRQITATAKSERDSASCG